jgi:hypothetical protein
VKRSRTRLFNSIKLDSTPLEGWSFTRQPSLGDVDLDVVGVGIQRRPDVGLGLGDEVVDEGHCG